MFQLNLVFKKRSFWAAFSVALFFSVLSFVLACIERYGHEINSIASAEKLFIWGTGEDRVFLMLFFLLPVLSVLPFADSYIAEKERNMLPVFLPRVGAKKYLSGKLLAVAASAFFVACVPLLLNLILCMATFPVEINGFSQISADQSWYFSPFRMQRLLFPALTVSHPYLLCLLSILLTGIFCALMAVLVCEASFFFSMSRVLILALFFIVNTLLTIVSTVIAFEKISCFAPFYYLTMFNSESGKALWFLPLMFFVPAVLIGVLFVPCEKRIKKCWG